MSRRRTRTRPIPVGSPARARVVAVAGVLLTLTAAMAATAVLRHAAPSGAAPTADAVAVPGGYLIVEDVKPEVMTMSASMPRAMMPDPLPDGARRVTVHVTLLAADDTTLPYRAADLTLTALGTAPVAPRRDTIGTGTLPPGARLTGTVLFQVPADVGRFRLRLGTTGTAAPITVPAGGGHDHGAEKSADGAQLSGGLAGRPGR